MAVFALVVACVVVSALPLARGVTECVDGWVHAESGSFACEGFDLLGHLSLDELSSAPGDTQCDTGGDGGSDMWGWTDPATQDVYLLVGMYGCTAIALVRDSVVTYLGFVPSYGKNSYWKDIKVVGRYAVIGSEAAGYGLQVVDMHAITSRPDNTPRQYPPAATYTAVQRSHNVVVNEDTNHGFIVGTHGGDSCGTGAHVVDLSDPLQPTKLACIDEGYIHDAQCVTYAGPDADHVGKEICFMCTGDGTSYDGPASLDAALLVYDVTNWAVISRTSYPNAQYSHQGWLTDDHAFFLLGDEFYELENAQPATTIVFDVSNLDAPVVATVWHDEGEYAITHNLYMRGSLMFQANYQSGIRVREFNPQATTPSAFLTNIAHFDTNPANGLQFNGAWNVFPFVPGLAVVAVSDINSGLLVLRPHEYVRARIDDTPPECRAVFRLMAVRSMPAMWEHARVCSGVE